MTGPTVVREYCSNPQRCLSVVEPTVLVQAVNGTTPLLRALFLSTVLGVPVGTQDHGSDGATMVL
jgi:hypothetical protein